jgi:integrase
MMASISTDPGGRRRVQFVDPSGSRKTIRLGKVSMRAAEAVKFRVEQLLAAKLTGHALETDTAKWVRELQPEMAKKLAAVGLIILPESSSQELGPFLEAWIKARESDYKPASIVAWRQVSDALIESLGESTPLRAVTPGKAEDFRQAMVNSGLRATTIHKRLQHARMFFAAALRHGLVAENPFSFVRHRPGDAAERRAYVPAADAWKAIEAAPGNIWKLLIALSRFGGLRVPSEALSLRWRDVDWENQRLKIPSPKTEHLAGRGYRTIPLFPEIRPFLDAAFDDAPDGAEYVFPDEYRRRAQGPGGWANANLRTTLERIIRRAGISPWPRLWHSMRASRETDLVREYPLPVVAKWLGNTQAVAMRHYVDVTDADFDRAVNSEAAQNAAQQAHALARKASLTPDEEHEKTPDLPSPTSSCGTVQNRGMEAAGIEPASRDMSVQASTCVAADLYFAGPVVRRQTTAPARGELVEPRAYSTWPAANRN